MRCAPPIPTQHNAMSKKHGAGICTGREQGWLGCAWALFWVWGTVHWVGWWAGSQEGDVVVGGHRCRARCVVVQHDWFWLDVQCVVVVVMLGWNRDVPSHGVLSCICLAPRLAVVAAREHLWRSCWGGWGGVRWCGVPILGGVFLQCVGSLSRHGTVPSVPSGRWQLVGVLLPGRLISHLPLCVCVMRAKDVVLRAGWGHSCFWWGWGHSRAVSGDGGSALLACVPVCHTS